MSHEELPGGLGKVEWDGELPRRADVGLVFDELDYQMACQVYLWALPLVSYAQWHQQHRDVFGATNFDLVHYVTYRDRLGLITANATTPYILNFIELAETGPLVIELPAGPTAGGVSDFWQREIGVLGEMGPDAGRGGKHLVVPPGQDPPDDIDGLQRAALDGDEHHVRVPHPRPRSGPLEGAGRRRADLPVRPARRPAGDTGDLAGRPGVDRRPAAWPGVLGAAARHLPVRGGRRARPVLPGHAEAARDREGSSRSSPTTAWRRS